ncbi:hypothetical protein ACFVYR_23760 [Streptomyces sp. NPDC058284]|uniref:SCO2102 family sporulation regulator n=1 Tax=unclassified Streptomyces TaxID=2593676 RepID=UPI0036571ED3
MGWTVLYIAFGFVALWLLGEVLLQYKARLRWRLLAFVGFLGVVVGVLIPAVWIIALGAIAFATGQTYVTLSFRRGFSTGWAIGGRPGPSRRRKKQPSRAAGAAQEPTLQVSDLEYEPVPPPPAHGPDASGNPDFPAHPDFPADADIASGGIYAPEPLPDDTGQYGVYSDSAYTPPAPDGTPRSDGYGYEAAAFPGHGQQGYGYDETGQQQYAAYSDPYIGTQTYGAQSYDGYGDQQQYAPYGGDTYGGLGETYNDTPPGGVWVPLQRTTDDPPHGGELPQEQPYPYGHGDGNTGGHDGQGYNEQQYRY